jgi:hypothetical protein
MEISLYEWLITKAGLIPEAIDLLKHKKIGLINAMTLSSLSKEKQKRI